MAPKNREPTNAQLSSRLSYQQEVPSFLLKLRNRVATGRLDDDEDEPQYDYGDDGAEYYDDGSGRPPIPQRPREDRPAIPERPDEEPGSADEDSGDEKPQVVVLRQGKHLTEREAENIRRREKGLPPLPNPDASTSKDAKQDGAPEAKPQKSKLKEPPPSLSFSSSGTSGKASSSSNKKRKIIDTDPDFNALKDSVKLPKTGSEALLKKKPKKEKKTLLSFADDA